jgi:hypothetical protein
MDPILEEMLRGNSSPEEFSVSAIIAEYLLENSETFKNLTDLRIKV